MHRVGGGSGGAGKRPAPVAVDVVPVVSRPIDVEMTMPGELEPYEAVAVYPKVTGFLKTIRVDRGSRVRAGELMAVLDAPELVARRAEAQSKLQGAEAQLAAARAKADADASTGEKLPRPRGRLAPSPATTSCWPRRARTPRAARSRRLGRPSRPRARRSRRSRRWSRYLRITAPFDGVVTERNVHPGALVGPGGDRGASAPMLRVVDNRRLRLVVPVPEAYVAGVATGASVSFTVPAYPGQAFTGVVARIAHAIDVKTRTMAVELEVANADERLAPGAFCQVRWPVRRPAPSLLVPSGAVASTTDRVFVVRVRGGRAEWVDVKTGLVSGPLVEVFGDLRAGDDVAVRGTDELRPGTAVRPNVAARRPS